MDFKVLLEKITPALKGVARKHLLYGFYDAEDLYQEMCLYLWQNYSQGLPIGINESYVIKGCEFHIQNFLRKGRPKVSFSSLEEPTSAAGGEVLGDILEDKSVNIKSSMDEKITVDEIRNMDLNDKEKAVFSYLLNGYTVREIAKELGVSHVMILKHKKEIIKKWKRKGYQR